MSVEPGGAAVSGILDVLAQGGDRTMAARELLPPVYAELRRLAAQAELGRARRDAPSRVEVFLARNAKPCRPTEHS